MGSDPLESGLARMDKAMQARGLWPTKDSPWVRHAMFDSPRHRFAPDTVWLWDGHTWVSVARATQPERWADLVYPEPEDSTVTQVGGGLATSSLSCVSVVADMLDSLMAAPRDRVLELGTGAGWNAALLAHRVGPGGQVVSVEIDSGLAEAAVQRLERAGVDVEIRIGDGAAGAVDASPYDRLIATYAVEAVPWAWIQQVRPGGRLVFPWGRMGHFALTVADDGQSASGWLQGLALFMGDRLTSTAASAPPAAVPDGDGATDEELFTDLLDGHLLFALRVSHPHIIVTVGRTSAGPHVNLRDTAGHSARAEQTPGDARVSLCGDGQDLWGALRAGHRLWHEHGRPEQWDFGMTVTRADQTVWAGSEDNGPYTG